MFNPNSSNELNLSLSKFPDGDKGLYRTVHALLIREGLVFQDINTTQSHQHKLVPISCTLFPTLFPMELYSRVLEAQITINKLFYAIARDRDFLYTTLKSTFKDEFTKKMWEIYENTREYTINRPTIGLLRSDYMLHNNNNNNNNNNNIKQVEVNAIAVSLAFMSQKLEKVHSKVSQLFNRETNFPSNTASDETIQLFSTAYTLYNSNTSALLILSEAGNSNWYELLDMQWVLLAQHSIKSFIMDINTVYENSHINPDGTLFVHGTEIYLCYYRQGYNPEHYTPEGWLARGRLEQSRAYQLPDIGTQLAGTKRVQQELTVPGALERFISDEKAREQLRSLFAEQIPLNLGEEGDLAVKKAEANPEGWVMKPQREGGGNNVYGEDMITQLRNLIGQEERGMYILMEMLKPSSELNCLITAGSNIDSIHSTSINTEIGIYGMYIVNNNNNNNNNSNNWICNVKCGYIARSKGIGVQDGGVCSGRAHLDTINLINNHNNNNNTSS